MASFNRVGAVLAACLLVSAVFGEAARVPIVKPRSKVSSKPAPASPKCSNSAKSPAPSPSAAINAQQVIKNGDIHDLDDLLEQIEAEVGGSNGGLEVLTRNVEEAKDKEEERGEEEVLEEEGGEEGEGEGEEALSFKTGEIEIEIEKCENCKIEIEKGD